MPRRLRRLDAAAPAAWRSLLAYLTVHATPVSEDHRVWPPRPSTSLPDRNTTSRPHSSRISAAAGAAGGAGRRRQETSSRRSRHCRHETPATRRCCLRSPPPAGGCRRHGVDAKRSSADKSDAREARPGPADPHGKCAKRRAALRRRCVVRRTARGAPRACCPGRRALLRRAPVRRLLRAHHRAVARLAPDRLHESLRRGGSGGRMSVREVSRKNLPLFLSLPP